MQWEVASFSRGREKEKGSLTESDKILFGKTLSKNKRDDNTVESRIE